MKRSTSVFATAVLLAACTQNPYPNGRLQSTEPDKVPPAEKPLVFEIAKSAEVFENQPFELPFKATVRKPGKPVITVVGLPAGAVFDEAKGKITWNPDFDAANDPRDKDAIVRRYDVDFSLSSSEDPISVSKAGTVIIVRDVPREMSINVPAVAPMISEGQVYEQTLEVTSADFPDGPFPFPQVENNPTGMLITKDLTAPNRFKLTYTPSYREVNFKEFTGGSRDVIDRVMKVTAFGPRGASVTAPMTWRIKDTRANAVVLAPTQITGASLVSFPVSAEDLNGEEPPDLTLSPRPAFGLAELRVESRRNGDPARGVNPATTATFRWTQIPPEKLGTSENVSIRACVKRSAWEKTLCTTHTVKVTFELDTHKAPIIERGAFPAGVVKYIRQEEKASITVAVRDGEFVTTPPKVTIEPASDEVNWGMNRLNLEGKRVGLKQFQLKAESVFGVVSMQPFLLEVLPKRWANVVLFGEGPSDPEVKGSLPIFDSVQVANPVLQLTDPRLMVLRKVAFMGTSAMVEPSVQESLAKLVASAPDFVLSTPLIGKVEGELKTELAGIEPQPRLADVTGYSLELVPSAGLSAPTDPIRLRYALTAESKNPTPLKITRPFGCQPILQLKKTGADDLVVAAVCARKGAGKMLVAGIELADIQTGPSDNGLVKEWLSTLVGK